MNLIQDAWIPVRRKNGEKLSIAPWQITEGTGQSEIIELAAPRPDFNGALIQFLIGLVQTACPPKNPREWREWMQTPPKPQDLKKLFDSLSHIFNLDGDGPRFMQDLSLQTGDMDSNQIGSLLLETPGDNTLKKNTDFFIKSKHVAKQMCLPCTAISLWTLQVNAPSGGQGHRTGLRGGGPLTTVVAGGSLWKTVWSNILEENAFNKGGNLRKNSEENCFPWMSKIRTSEGDQSTTPDDVNPMQQYWAMPRRIRLEIVKDDSLCDLCGISATKTICRAYYTKNYGINYLGSWAHPLSPYRTDLKTGESFPWHLHEEIGYHLWLGIAQKYSDKKVSFRVARVIERMAVESNDDFRIWAFGFDMDNMKARCWHEGVMPVVTIDPKIKAKYEHYTEVLVLGAKGTADQLRWRMRLALFAESAEIKGDLSYVTDRFWEETEEAFYHQISNLRESLKANHDVNKVLEGWRIILARKAESIFDEITQNGAAYEAVDPGRIARSAKYLKRWLYGSKLRELLGLPNPEGLEE